MGNLTLEAQQPLPIYTDHLVNGFQDWSWGTRNFTNTTVVHSGSASISHDGGAWNGLSLEHSDFNATLYSSLVFWANGGSGGGQILQVYAQYGTSSAPPFGLSALPANAWKQYSIPLSALGVASVTNLNRLTLQITASGPTTQFFIDDVELTPAAAPATVYLEVDATQPLRAADARWFGLNTAVWDDNLDSPTTISLLRELGTRILRFPGGSLSDEYHWASNKSLNNNWQWGSSFADFTEVATNIGAQAFITVNYGTGTPAEAAAWVRHSNITNHLGFKYWEIGNECYGGWETDTNANPHDPYTYALRAADYIEQMKAADPTIKVGVVVVTGEDSYSNQFSLNHPAHNPRTGAQNYGWTPILLATLKSLGVTPDFAVYHNYPEYTGAESDPLLLQSSVSWASDAADLRQQFTDYFGSQGAGIELVCTENNSNSGSQGKQSTSLVNGLYYADSLGQLMKTEFNSFVWWDLRNGTDYSGSMDPTLYGWRMYGDLGIVGGPSTRYPAFYAAKLMGLFIQPGDSVLNAASDYPLLSAYAARRESGALELLVINKDTTSSFTAQDSLSGFTPDASATIHSYGIPQDEAARTNASSTMQNIAESSFLGAAASFNYAFPPLSLTMFSFDPSRPSLKFSAALPGASKFVFELDGQPGAQYVILSSSDLETWIPVSTNRVTTSSLLITNPITAGQSAQFWRAVWEP
ncbi:MAG TPA: alpha-L-arabinofuranosidase [Verrucomicrobiae bacterium]|nr:alpha-L-arabinofuranosidase [Verrucomicrobiae bacterium]